MKNSLSSSQSKFKFISHSMWQTTAIYTIIMTNTIHFWKQRIPAFLDVSILSFVLNRSHYQRTCFQIVVSKRLPYLTSCSFVANIIFASWKHSADWKRILEAQQGMRRIYRSMYSSVCGKASLLCLKLRIQDSGHWPHYWLWLTWDCL